MNHSNPTGGFHGRALVIGDIMLDHYVFGQVDRICPEAPVPVLHTDPTAELWVAGGAGNVAMNLAALGVDTMLVGHGPQSPSGLWGNIRGMFSYEDVSPIVKHRFVAGKHLMLRVDDEKMYPALDPRLIDEAVDAADPDVIVIADYDKGSVASYTLDPLKDMNIPILVDTKPNNVDIYQDMKITLLKPNLKEAMQMAGPRRGDDPASLGISLAQKFMARHILITHGATGMTLVGPGKQPVTRAPEVQDVFDVTGAGDTVMAVVAGWIASGGIPDEAMLELANRAAGIVCRKFGTCVVGRKELFNADLPAASCYACGVN